MGMIGLLGAMVLGDFQCSLKGHPTNSGDNLRQGPTMLVVGASGGCLDAILSSIISLYFLLSVGEGPVYTYVDQNTVSKGS